MSRLWGIGKRTAARLAAHDLRTVTDLALADRDDLAAWFGPTIGPRLRALARGGSLTGYHDRAVASPIEEPPGDVPSDLTDPEDIGQEVAAMARELCAEIKAGGRQVTHVGVTVRTRSFFTQVKTSKLPEVTTDPAVVEAGARAVLARFDINRPVRLLGVRLDLEMPTPDTTADAPPQP